MLSSSAAKRRTTTAQDVRRINRSTVLHHLLIDGEMSRQDLSQHSGLSAATVSSVIWEVVDAGIVVESGLAESHGGRPGALFRMNADAGRCVGIAVAETFVLFELFDAALTRLESLMVRTSPKENRPEQIVASVVDGLDALLDRHKLPMESVLGIGLSVPGLVQYRKGVAVFAPNWGWHNVPLVSMLRQRISAPLYIDNALKFFAIAESWFGTGRGVDNLITLVIGTGVGAGIILNGSLLRGETNSAGEWGHTCIVLDGRRCRCGKQGCVEAYVGAPGIIATFRELDGEYLRTCSDDQEACIGMIADLARQGDPVALETLSRTASYLGVGIANLINLFNPQMIVLTGWCGQGIGPLIRDSLNDSLALHAMEYPLKAAEVVLGQMRPEAATIGAATLALEQYLSGAQITGVRGALAHGEGL